MRRRVVDADVMEPGLVEETKQRQRSDENRQSNQFGLDAAHSVFLIFSSNLVRNQLTVVRLEVKISEKS
jgi:hypothetical protein